MNYSGKTLLLVREDVRNPNISEHVLLDDKLIEVSCEGEILWSWSAHEHFEELGFDDSAKTVLFREPNLRKLTGRAVGDWLHINSASFVGANRHFDAGDQRFHPESRCRGLRVHAVRAVPARAAPSPSIRRPEPTS